MLLFSLFEEINNKMWKNNRAAGAAWKGCVWLMLIIVSAVCVYYIHVSFPMGYVFGFPEPGFESADYFPLLPWFFVFMLGAWFGIYVKERRLPERFFTQSVPVLPWFGRHSLLIYLIHQPVLYGLTLLIITI